MDSNWLGSYGIRGAVVSNRAASCSLGRPKDSDTDGGLLIAAISGDYHLLAAGKDVL